jgi:lysozyme
MRRALKAIVVSGAVIVAAVAGAWLYFVNYSPDRARYPVRGLDVSHHQGDIDWAQVAADDVSFAFIKATEGGDFVDSDFAKNLADARAADVAVGAYHFFTLCRPGVEQAANFLATVPLDLPLLPPAVDLEYEGNCSARPSSDEVRKELDAFLAPVEAAFGKQAIFYVTYQFYNDHIAALPERPLWVRWIAWQPNHDDWLLWQYHDRGRVDGIAGDVDLNVLQGGPETLSSLLGAP